MRAKKKRGRAKKKRGMAKKKRGKEETLETRPAASVFRPISDVSYFEVSPVSSLPDSLPASVVFAFDEPGVVDEQQPVEAALG
jgi:hypothetical protein